MKHDPVSHPSHYTQGGIECIDAIEAAVCNHTADPVGAFLTGQVIKYMWRWPFKVKPLEDLKKAKWYLDRLIQRVEAMNKDAEPMHNEAYERQKRDYEARMSAALDAEET
jgi:hypothetical protein